MKYFLDTEFIEGTQKKLFGVTKPTIDLISIGIVAQDGREYYAISKEFNLKKAWNRSEPNVWPAKKWIRENVLKPIYDEFIVQRCVSKDMTPDFNSPFAFTIFKEIIKKHGKTNLQIAKEIFEFVNPDIDKLIYTATRADSWNEQFYPKEFEYIRTHNTFTKNYIYKSGNNGDERNKELIYNQPEFYGNFAYYDWVVFCWLFGKMLNLPKGFPKYCRDLKQMMDEKQKQLGDNKIVFDFKGIENYPTKINEHNALADARWNRELFDFLNAI